MAYSELVKNFNRIRSYMREFYVYGFKSRDEYNKKSARTYDDERRRVESRLGEYMQFRKTAKGKNVFLSIDSRAVKHNPLYKAWRTKSFTEWDITLHFLLFDILHKPDIVLSLSEIMERLDEKMSGFERTKTFDESGLRKKLKEYIKEGLITSEKKGRAMYYRRTDSCKLPGYDCLDFFSEVAPCGVIGSYILDRTDKHKENFTFKHHYITSAMDSEVLRMLFEAIGDKREIEIEKVNKRETSHTEKGIVPLKIFISVQSGRQYLMAFSKYFSRITGYRIDSIVSVKIGEPVEEYDSLRSRLERAQRHIWGVGTQGRSGQRMEHVEFTVKYEDWEQHIHSRLEREKRCGQVERIDKNTSRFSADIYDSTEIVPWIRTFICRITDISFSDKELEKKFMTDIDKMYAMYGVEGGEADDIQ